MPGSNRRLRTALLAPALLLLALLGGGASPAHAGTDTFCVGSVSSTAPPCQGVARALTSVKGTVTAGNASGCGGTPSLLYCALPSGCRVFTQGSTLTPAIRPLSSTRNMSGSATWGSTGAASGCPNSGAGTVGLARSVTGLASRTTGVPVLDEAPAVTAPDEVAELVPDADPGAARRIDTPAGDGWVLVDVRTQGVCLVVASPDGNGYGANCTPMRAVRAEGATSAFVGADQTSAAGDIAIVLAPAGVDEVTVDRDGVADRVVPVHDGVVAVRLGKRDRSVVVPDGDGGVAQQMQMRRH